MASQMVIKDAVRKRWRAEWSAICVGRYGNDYDIARLAHTIRADFPEGLAGDRMFCAFVGQTLEGCRPEKMLDKAIAFDVFPESEWRRLGGWRGLSFLRAFSEKDRRRLLEAFPGDGPHHYWKLYAMAKKLKLRTRRTRTVTAEQKPAAVMQDFIMRLLLNGTVRSIPPEVMAVLPSTMQRAVERAHGVAAA